MTTMTTYLEVVSDLYTVVSLIARQSFRYHLQTPVETILDTIVTL